MTSRASRDAQSPVPASGAGAGVAGPSEGDTAPCLFCDRAAHEILGESYSWYIRLDAYPANPGHVELVTKRHVVSLFDLDGAESAELCGTLNYARNLVTARFGAPDGWTIGVNEGRAAGRSIDHVHVHLIPRRHGDVPDPRGGIRRGLPNGDPDAWGGTAPPRTADEWNRQSVAAFIANHSPKGPPVLEPEPAPTDGLLHSRFAMGLAFLQALRIGAVAHEGRVREQVAADMKRAAAGRRDYATRAPEHIAAELESEARVFDTAARVAANPREVMWGLLPASMWTAADRPEDS